MPDERKQKKVHVTDQFKYSEKLDDMISILQRARTVINRNGWTNPSVEIDKTDEFEQAYIQVIAWRYENDSELYVRQLQERERQEALEAREREQLKRLQEKYDVLHS